MTWARGDGDGDGDGDEEEGGAGDGVVAFLFLCFGTGSFPTRRSSGNCLRPDSGIALGGSFAVEISSGESRTSFRFLLFGSQKLVQKLKRSHS